MYVLAVSNDSSQVKTTGTAMVVSLVTSIVALIGTFVTYWKFRRQLFTDTITKERLNFIKDWRECAACFCGLLALKMNLLRWTNLKGTNWSTIITNYF